MNIPKIFNSVLVGGAVGLSLMAWQGWQQSLMIDLDPRLDPATLLGMTADPPRHQELGVLHTPTFFWKTSLWPPARLRLAFDPPGKNYGAALYRQVYVQVVGPFQNLMPPIEIQADGSVAFVKGQKVYTAEPLVYSRYRRDCPTLVLLRTPTEVIDKLAHETDAIGILNTDAVIPRLRALTSPMPVRLWVGWQTSPSKWLSTIGLNLRLFEEVARYLSNARVQPKPRLMTLVAVGDMMLARRIGEAIDRRIKKNTEPLFPFTAMKETFQRADVVLGNLECAVAAGGSPQPGKDYTFRSDPKVAERLHKAGFTLLDLANNHSMDYGADALRETLLHLDKAGLKTIGGGLNYRQAQSVKIQRLKDGTRLGFLSYTLVVPEGFAATSDQPGVNWMEDDRFKRQVQRARRRCDVLVIQFHWGKEYQMHPNDLQRRYGHRAIDYGADLVLGHHPHWIQEMEFYKGKFIAYSLGNFVFDMNHRPKVREGLMLKCLFKDKKLYQVGLDPVMIQRGKPEIVPWGSRDRRSRETILKEVFEASGFGR